MGMITAVVRKKNRVQIDVDGRFYMNLRASDYDKCPVLEGEAIDETEYEDRLSAVQYPEAYEAALTQLDYCQRSSGELRKKLAAKGFAAPAVNAVIDRLIEVRLLDDNAYAQRIVESMAKKPVGVYAAKRKLRAKGFSEDDADDALTQLNDEQQSDVAVQLAKKLAPKYLAKGDTREAKAKLSQALARRGFGWDIVREAVSAALEDADADDWD